MTFPAYPEYKDSGVEWVGKVPTAWKVRSLKHLTKLKTEKASSKSFSIALENIESWSGRFIETNSEFEGDGIKFSKDNILFGKLRPYLAKVYLTECEGEAVGDLYVLQPTSEANPRYFQYRLLTREFIDVIDGSTYGSKMPRASWDFMGNMKFPIPSKIEQESIVYFLDHETSKIDSLIAEQKQLIEFLNEKRQSVISNAVCRGLNPNVPMKDSGVEWLGMVPSHWSVEPLKNLISIQNGADYKHIESTEGYPVVGSGGKFTFASEFMHNGESVLLGRKGTIDKPLYLNEPFWAVDTMYWSKILPKGFAKFVYYSALTIPFNLYSTNTALPSMTKSVLGSHKVTCPSLNEQIQIANYLDTQTQAIDDLIEEQEKLNILLNERRSALISAAVCGQIDVRSFQS